MRVLPIAWEHFFALSESNPRQNDAIQLHLLRIALSSSLKRHTGRRVNLSAIRSATNRIYASFEFQAAAYAAFTARSNADVLSAKDPPEAVRAAADAVKSATDALFFHSTVFSSKEDQPNSDAGKLREHAQDIAAVQHFYEAVRIECSALQEDTRISKVPLWPAGSNPLKTIWTEFKDKLLRDGKIRTNSSQEKKIDWSFWIDWYESALDGTEHRWEMLTDVALMEEEYWTGSSSEAMKKIADIVAQHKQISKATEGKLEVFRATLFDFSYDHAEAVMRAVPLDRDWKHLNDPDLLRAFLEDAEDLREDLELFCEAMHSEGSAMQGAGVVRTYCIAILTELSRAADRQTLRVGKLVQYGRMIENARLDPSAQAEFGLLAPALQDNGQAILNLMRNHFARTLSRFAELRDIGIEEDASRWEVLQGFRDLVSTVRMGDGADRPALAQEDAAVLEDILDSVDRQMRALDATHEEGAIASLQRDINFELAKLGATIAIYRERAVSAEGQTGKVVDVTLKWQKRGLGLWAIVESLRKLF
ncbi:hypothetical protein C8N43_2859 [Litoreibacter ponti]|uniref:Uncharacterized protein n=2 Tax=Litoreibacter ponti TaxID=1510457 RepID=A0A2T6BDD0_9RHOB|nr:hypothetical protein C8N43_2859 [Litoreibacter ponti]